MIPIPQPKVVVIDQAREGHEKALFLYDGRRISRTKLHEFHKIYRHIAGLPGNVQFYPHIWRHTGITHYAQTEKDPKTLQSQTRHRDINVLYDRYVKKTDQELRKSYDKAFESISDDSSKSIAHKKMDSPVESKTKKKDDSTNNYIANPGIEPRQRTVQHSNQIELELKLIEQLANGEISNRVYNDAMTRLENINKNHIGNAVSYQ
ncbi:MAG: site-specific integrase [Thermoplasmatales archaeon]|nr:MAG: site-specific integrase [Thermoplasmatales archaeon]